MKILSLTIKNNLLIIKTLDMHYNRDVNSNVMVNDTLFYTQRFAKKNKEIINEIIGIKYIDDFVFEDFESFYLVGNILEYNNVTFDIEESLPTKVCNVLLDKKRIKYIKCYFMPSEYVHEFANRNVSVKFSDNYSFTLDFINSNGFKNLKSVYYKRIIYFYREEDVYENLDDFLKVNTSLKVIHLYFYADKVIDYITEELKKHKENEVSIYIHQNDFNKDNISRDAKKLRLINKTFNKKDKKIKIIYSNDFFNDNIFKDLTMNVIKLSLVIIMYFGFVLILSNKYHEYLSIVELRKLEMSLLENNNQIANNIDEIDDTDILEPEPEPEPEVPQPEPVPEEPKYINYYANIPTTFDKLLQINKNVVGWVRVNNTLANYPVLQGPYNEFYNTHDIYDREVITGWIYMDSRNNSKELDQNTIIYGHNLLSGYMFGDLKSTTNYSWYTNPENKYITFNTLDKEMKWEIFSIYRVDYTTDYLETNFFNDEQYMEFINLIKGRSIYNFNVTINPDDKILTLSTCSGHTRRLVVHAKLVK